MLSPDDQFWLGLGVGVVGIALAVAIAWYQRQVPSLEFECSESSNSPASLTCTLTNSGRGQATDVVLSFNFMLPVGTQVVCDAEIRATLEEMPSPPDPVVAINAAKLRRAFAVRIPRVAARDTVSFEVKTTDPDNIRAAEQIVRIRHEIEHVLAEFGGHLGALDASLAQRWNLPLIMSGRTKTDSLFRPAVLSYDRGRKPVSVLTAAEEEAAAWCQDLYAAFKPALLEVFQGRTKFKAPVFRIKTSEGVRTYATFPAFVSTYVEALARKPQPGKRVLVYPAVPESYA